MTKTAEIDSMTGFLGFKYTIHYLMQLVYQSFCLNGKIDLYLQ
jgi:hypothetical protein